MSRILLPALLALSTLSACGLPAGAEAGEVAGVRTVDVATLQADLAKGAVPLLIDVRTPGEYASGHVPGAVNVPLDELASRVSDLGPAEREVYVVCQSGNRSAKASALLAAQGRHPVNVAGGTSAWRSAGFPVE